MARIYSLKKGSKLPEDIISNAGRERIQTALVNAIGGASEVRLAYFNQETKKYEEHVYREELEITSLLGNITLKDGKPFLHAHCTFGRRDLTVLGGHLVSATVSPLLEVVVTPTENLAVREFDETTGLNVIKQE